MDSLANRQQLGFVPLQQPVMVELWRKLNEWQVLSSSEGQRTTGMLAIPVG
jgi:hypothetical protein